MATKKQPQPAYEGFNPFATIERLRTANLIIRTIPGEEWVLSCERHKNLLVDIYTLTGQERGARKPISYQCGRLGENFLRMMRYNRKAEFIRHDPHSKEESNVTAYTKPRMLADTFEEDVLIRLRDGDIVFKLIPGKRWRLTNTYFSGEMSMGVFYFADEETIGCPDLHIYKGRNLDYVLLEFFCQRSEFVEKQLQSKVLTFAPKA
jgi:hypothetical protein